MLYEVITTFGEQVAREREHGDRGKRGINHEAVVVDRPSLPIGVTERLIDLVASALRERLISYNFV